jgi:hypothetical protein
LGGADWLGIWTARGKFMMMIICRHFQYKVKCMSLKLNIMRLPGDNYDNDNKNNINNSGTAALPFHCNNKISYKQSYDT